ncbi:DUF547 domain-containing protein [Hymenobacter sp. HSC-4F20]|uniref:DUF547 domain-containing protein n=1 Tax=Hymenobacter sp. HSC-4F20 TaxID=2864135 RepID=UPI001C72C499|nr:DUF547 domain-containing protein [Hymenobacter sp. HSC-4F20]MBX0291993.1 DUF547 domain-containing protein [Hymenobacter sp. HSC-4F20]
MPRLSAIVFFRLLLLGLCLLSPAALHAKDNNYLNLLHQPWEHLIRHHVMADGRLDYEGLVEEEDVLLGYLANLRKVKPDPNSWSPDETKAFWLNVYNAAATSLVVQYYPVASINDIRVKTVGGVKSPWEAPIVNVGGQSYSLNQIEQQMLRDQFHDPRVHFALMYGAVSGAPLLGEAYDGGRLHSQLEEQTRRFINDPAFNQLTPQLVKLSGLFEAYAAEFGSEAQLVAFLNRYARTPLTPSALTIEYQSFNWALNDRTSLSSTHALNKR